MTGARFRPVLRSVREGDRWCTPSLTGYDAADSRLDDVSVSYVRFGSPVEHSHCFEALERAVAQARKAVRAWLLVDGSTGANRVAMRVVAARGPDASVLLAPNAHHSVMHAAMVCGVNVRFLPAAVVSGFDAILPRHPGRSRPPWRSIPGRPPWSSRARPTGGSWPTSRASPGSFAGTGRCSSWTPRGGAHFGYHPRLPAATAQTGADLVVESLHKCGGAPQGTGVLLLASGRVDHAEIDAAYRELMTTSPSFPLPAGIEGVTEAMAVKGRHYLHKALVAADELRGGLTAPGLPVLTHPRLGDGTKVTFAGVEGFAVAQAMEEQHAIVEKATAHTVLMLATMQLRSGAPGRALRALGRLVSGDLSVRGTRETPLDWLSATPLLEAHAVRRECPSAEWAPARPSAGSPPRPSSCSRPAFRSSRPAGPSTVPAWARSNRPVPPAAASWPAIPRWKPSPSSRAPAPADHHQSRPGSVPIFTRRQQ
jgi:hypothetical protein